MFFLVSEVCIQHHKHNKQQPSFFLGHYMHRQLKLVTDWSTYFIIELDLVYYVSP